jgi:hypothetical protein
MGLPGYVGQRHAAPSVSLDAGRRLVHATLVVSGESVRVESCVAARPRLARSPHPGTAGPNSRPWADPRAARIKPRTYPNGRFGDPISWGWDPCVATS